VGGNLYHADGFVHQCSIINIIPGLRSAHWHGCFWSFENLSLQTRATDFDF